MRAVTGKGRGGCPGCCSQILQADGPGDNTPLPGWRKILLHSYNFKFVGNKGSEQILPVL